MTNHRNKTCRRQRGGTVVGIIIGLIIGLAIALIVAVAITKTSLPFLNKGGKQDKAADLTPGQVADPNKPLYGNNDAAKNAAKDLASADAGGPAGTPPANAAAAPADGKAIVPIVPIAALPAANAKPGDAKAAVPPATVATIKPDNADDKWAYYLQAGAFRDQADAENSKAKLALAGFEASISTQQSDTGTLFRVRLGPFNQLEAMNRVRGKLSDNGIDAAVVRIAK